MADEGYPNKIKRPCLEDVTLPMGPSAHPSTLCAELQAPTLTMNPGSAAMGVAGQSLLLDNNSMNGSITGSPFGVPPNTEMGPKVPTIPYYEKINSMPAVDQELQDLLEELTKIQEPSSNDLDLEKILGSKPEEPLVLRHTQTTVETPLKLPVQMSQVDSLDSSKDFASSCRQVTGMALPILPSSTGISYSIPSTSKQMVSPSSLTSQTKNQAMLPASLPPLPVPQWHHAHQLKVLAANKQGSATKQQGPSPTWSGLPPPGLSPPYRPVPSPHPPPPPPPFSPQSFMVSCMSSNSSSNALLYSMASGTSATLGPTLPYAPEKLPSPALNQQPQFNPQSSILANLVSSTTKSPQGHLMSSMPSSNPGPSPPYRPEKLSSPGLPQQSFTPQYSLIRSLTPTSSLLSQQQQQQPPPPRQRQQQTNTIFKPMTSNASKTLGAIMHQGLASSSPEAPEPFTFGNTKPLSHFVSEPGLQKMPSKPATSRQPSLLHYLQQATPAPPSSAAASSSTTATLQLQQEPQQPDHSFLLQQVMQPPQHFHRPLASEPMPAVSRQQEKQRSGLMAMIPKQQNAYVAQQMSKFQAVQEQVTSKCSQPKASPPPSWQMTPSRNGLLQNILNPGISAPSGSQSCEGLGVILPTVPKGQGMLSSSTDFPMCPHSSQSSLGSLHSVCQHPQGAKATQPGVSLPKFRPSPLVCQPPIPHQFRQPSVPKLPTVLDSAAWVTAAAVVTTAVSREPPPAQTEAGTQQHFDSNFVFAKAPMKVSPVVPASQLGLVPPSHMTPGGEPGQKVSTTPANPSFSLLGNQSLRQSPVRGPVPVLNTKSLQQGMARFAPMSPVHGIEPPSYVAAAAAAATASAMTASQSLVPFSRTCAPSELLPSNFLAQAPLNDPILPPDYNEVDFLDALLKGSSKGPGEDWVGNLRLIDDILEQHAALQDATAQNAGQLSPGAGEL